MKAPLIEQIIAPDAMPAAGNDTLFVPAPRIGKVQVESVEAANDDQTLEALVGEAKSTSEEAAEKIKALGAQFGVETPSAPVVPPVDLAPSLPMVSPAAQVAIQTEVAAGEELPSEHSEDQVQPKVNFAPPAQETLQPEETDDHEQQLRYGAPSFSLGIGNMLGKLIGGSRSSSMADGINAEADVRPVQSKAMRYAEDAVLQFDAARADFSSRWSPVQSYIKEHGGIDAINANPELAKGFERFVEHQPGGLAQYNRDAAVVEAAANSAAVKMTGAKSQVDAYTRRHGADDGVNEAADKIGDMEKRTLSGDPVAKAERDQDGNLKLKDIGERLKEIVEAVLTAIKTLLSKLVPR